MTDRISAYTVLLSNDVRENDAQAIANALRMVKGVLRVDPHMADPAAAVIEMRVRNEIANNLMRMFHGDR